VDSEYEQTKVMSGGGVKAPPRLSKGNPRELKHRRGSSAGKV